MDKIEVCRAMAKGAVLTSPDGILGGRWMLDYGSLKPVDSVDTETVKTLKIESLIETASDGHEGYTAALTQRGKQLADS